MSSGKNSRLGELLGKNKLIAIFGVIVLYISSILLVIIGIIKLYYIIRDLINQLNSADQINTILLSASFINLIEIYLLAIIFYILAVGIFKLFVGKFTFLDWYHVESFDEMKAELAKAIVVFLSVFLVQKIVEWDDHERLLYIGAVIGLTTANLIWYIKSVKSSHIVHNNILPGEKI